MARPIDERGDFISNEPPARETLTPREARQGRLGRPVLYVLVCGILLAFLAWGAAEIWGEGSDRDAPVTTNTTSTTGNAVPNQPSGTGTFDDNPPAGQQQSAPVDRDPTPPSSTGGASQQVTPDGTAQ